MNDPLQQFLNEEVQQRIDCLVCYGAHHGEHCRQLWERCFECHLPAQCNTDHAEKCSSKARFRSEQYVEPYVKAAALRLAISFDKQVRYLSSGQFVSAKVGEELFSGLADCHFKFISHRQIELKTTGFTRIRLPLVTQEANGTLTERLVLITSHDRTAVAVKSSRVVSQANILADHEHNTPLVLILDSACATVSVDIYSGGCSYQYVITFDGKKFKIPDDLNIASNDFVPKLFDAEFPFKKMKRN